MSLIIWTIIIIAGLIISSWAAAMLAYLVFWPFRALYEWREKRVRERNIRWAMVTGTILRNDHSSE